MGEEKFIKKVGILLFELGFDLVFKGVVFSNCKVLDFGNLFKGNLGIILFWW